MEPPENRSSEHLLDRLDHFDLSPTGQALRVRMRGLLGLAPGAAVVDVGCGSGRAAAELSAEGARALGVDRDRAMVATARERRPGVRFLVGDAYGLPLADGAVRGYRAEKVYHSLEDPAGALAEARRVLAPGGRVVIAGQDWDAYMVDSAHEELTRTVVGSYAASMPNPCAPRRLSAELAEAGFSGVRVEGEVLLFTGADTLPMLLGLAEAARAVGAVTAEEARVWSADQRARADRGALFVAVPFFLVSADRP